MPALLERDPGLAELMQHFAGRLADDVAALCQSAADGNLAAVGEKARELRTAASRYNWLQLGEMAGQLEFSASAGNAGAVEALIGNIGHLAKIIMPQAPGTAGDDGTPIVSELLAEGPDMADLVEYFRGRLPGYLQILQEALAAADLTAIKKQAHDLKAVGGGYGYPQVTELAIRIEAVAGEGRLAELAALVEAFGVLARRIEAGVAGAVDEPEKHGNMTA